MLDLPHITKRNYNILGRGISFDSNDDDLIGYMEGGGRLFSDSLAVVPKVMVKSFTDFLGYERAEGDPADNREDL